MNSSPPPPSFAPPRRAGRVAYPRRAPAREALGAVLDECLAQVTHNAIGLMDGDGSQQVEHVHQLRIGVRRLRSALRSFDGWAPAPPAELVEGLKALFTTLGKWRDRDVLQGDIATALAKAGAPRLTMPTTTGSVDPQQAVGDDAMRHVFRGWIAWRASLAEPAAPDVPARRFHRKAQRRLRRWHERIAADGEAFDELDEPALHSLRKRIKRQRYAVEFFAPLLRRDDVDRYLKPLAAVQERMGELVDLFAARACYQERVEAEPRAWFALGWIAARIAEVRAQARVELGVLARTDAPSR